MCIVRRSLLLMDCEYQDVDDTLSKEPRNPGLSCTADVPCFQFSPILWNDLISVTFLKSIGALIWIRIRTRVGFWQHTAFGLGSLASNAPKWTLYSTHCRLSPQISLYSDNIIVGR